MTIHNTLSLAGKTVAVTGGGGVLCGTLSKALAAVGARVAVLDLRQEAADAVAKDILAEGHTAKGYACNVLDRASLEAARDAIVADFGSIDVLLNGAGGNHPKGTTSNETLSAADLDSVEPGKPTAHVVKVFEPAKRQAGVKINEETAAESAIKAVDMMAAAKLL